MIPHWADDVVFATIVGLVWAFAWMLGAASGRAREGARWRVCAGRGTLVFSEGKPFRVYPATNFDRPL